MSDAEKDGAKRAGAEVLPSSFGELRSDIRALNDNVRRLTDVVDRNTQQLSRVEVLEANHNHHGAALGRAFEEVKKVDDALEEHKVDDLAEHDKFKKALWFATGFFAAVSIFWTILGVHINGQVDSMVRTVNEMRVYMAINAKPPGRQVVP